MRWVVCALGAILLGGCALNNKTETHNETHYDAAEFDKSLDHSLSVIADSWRVIAETNNASAMRELSKEQMAQMQTTVSAMPYGLDKPINLPRWPAEASSVIRVIAEITGWHFQEPLGRAPSQGLMVQVNAVNRPAYDVLRDIGTQIGSRGDVRVIVNKDKNKPGVIELVYKEAP